MTLTSSAVTSMCVQDRLLFCMQYKTLYHLHLLLLSDSLYLACVARASLGIGGQCSKNGNTLLLVCSRNCLALNFLRVEGFVRDFDLEIEAKLNIPKTKCLPFNSNCLCYNNLGYLMSFVIVRLAFSWMTS